MNLIRALKQLFEFAHICWVWKTQSWGNVGTAYREISPQQNLRQIYRQSQSEILSLSVKINDILFVVVVFKLWYCSLFSPVVQSFAVVVQLVLLQAQYLLSLFKYEGWHLPLWQWGAARVCKALDPPPTESPRGSSITDLQWLRPGVRQQSLRALTGQRKDS